MQYTSLGRSGVQVSRLCLGTMNFGPRTTEPDAHGIMTAALDAGINFFDTANVYGGQRGEGITERIVGRWLAADPGRRDRIVLATKVYGRMGDGPNDQRLSAYHIRRACEDSLRRLGTDRIDLYQMHHVDRDTPWDEIWQAMEQLVAQGKVLYVGSSNFAGWHVARACETARARGSLGLVSEQSLYNLRVRTVELEVAPACQAYGVGIIPWSPLGAGVLAGRDLSGGGRREGEFQRTRSEAHRTQLERYDALCKEIGASMADVAVAWLLHRPGVTAPIIGPRTAEQLHGSLRAVDVTLDERSLKALDEIWPGPGGAAPEAYAW